MTYWVGKGIKKLGQQHMASLCRIDGLPIIHQRLWEVNVHVERLGCAGPSAVQHPFVRVQHHDRDQRGGSDFGRPVLIQMLSPLPSEAINNYRGPSSHILNFSNDSRY